MTYEPYLSTVRSNPQAGKIIATTLDYPMIMDTFGCTPKFLADNPKAAKALADSYFEAVEMIKKDPKKSFEIMGADVKQTGEQFEASQKYLRWQDSAANQKFFAGEHAAVQQGSGRPAARDRHHQAACPTSRSSSTRGSSSSAHSPTRARRDRALPARGTRVSGSGGRAGDARCTVKPLVPVSRARKVALGIAFFVAVRRRVERRRRSAASCRRRSSPIR